MGFFLEKKGVLLGFDEFIARLEDATSSTSVERRAVLLHSLQGEPARQALAAQVSLEYVVLVIGQQPEDLKSHQT